MANTRLPESIAPAPAHGADRSPSRSQNRQVRQDLTTRAPPCRWPPEPEVPEVLGLLLTDRPITQIATDVGYRTTSAFGTAFRRTMGVPPSAYRREPPPTPAG